MTKLAWGALAKRTFEAGVDRGVFYPSVGPGVAWEGIVSVVENAEESTQAITYFDGEAIQNQLTLGNYQATLEALTYPQEFEAYDGVSEHLFYEQVRKSF